jgi:hypothetical protein
VPDHFVVTCPLRGVPIRCREDTWFDHIVDEHNVMEDREDEVQRALAAPMAIYQDADLPAVRLCFYGRPRTSTAMWFTKVVVEYAQDSAEVVTAYLTPSIKRSEMIVWKP